MDTSVAPSGSEDNDSWSVHRFEEPPGPGAPAADVARYLYDEVESGGMLWNDDGPFEPMSTWRAKEYCAEYGHVWRSVSPEVRHLRARGIAQRHPSPVVVTTQNGFQENSSVFQGLRDERWTPRCPRTTTGFNAHDGFADFTTVGDCSSWWCQRCGPKHLVRVHALVAERVKDLTVVYTSVAPYNAKVCGTVRQRAKSAQAEYFWYRHINYRADAEEVAYVATRDLGLTARTEPKVFVARSPQEALDWLRTDVMIFPDYIRHDWSESWEPKKVPDDRRQPSGDWLWFRGLDADQADVARVVLGRRVRETLGLDLDDPSSVVSKPKRMLIKLWLQQIVDEVRGARSTAPA